MLARRTPRERKIKSRHKTGSLFGVPKGIRTPVTAVKGQCPRPLDDRDFKRNLLRGGGKRDRTADLLHAMQALSQLSYTPTKGAHYTGKGRDLQKSRQLKRQGDAR